MARVSAPVWNLGWTSLFTDISSEMVNSVLPMYLVLHLHLSPLHYGVVDGIYNGFAIVLLSLIAGVAADRGERHKTIALLGYGMSTVCKLALLLVGGAWTVIVGIVSVDRLGKGIRTAPRDALISLHTKPEFLATAFAAHRALDAGGMLLGPMIAFGVLWLVPNAFDAVWVASLAFGVVGLAVLGLFVPQPRPPVRATAELPVWSAAFSLFRTRQFSSLAICGFALALATISDAFLYLQVQQKSSVTSSFFPLFYVLTASSYMLFSFPTGRLADRFGRVPMFLCGYLLLAVIYLAVQSMDSAPPGALIVIMVVLGIYYAATEGILMAITSTVVAPELRTSGIALIATAVGLGKMGSSLLFGYAWQSLGAAVATRWFACILIVFLFVSTWLLTGSTHFRRTSVR